MPKSEGRVELVREGAPNDECRSDPNLQAFYAELAASLHGADRRDRPQDGQRDKTRSLEASSFHHAQYAFSELNSRSGVMNRM